jgi:hypothetical protein
MLPEGPEVRGEFRPGPTGPTSNGPVGRTGRVVSESMLGDWSWRAGLSRRPSQPDQEAGTARQQAGRQGIGAHDEAPGVMPEQVPAGRCTSSTPNRGGKARPPTGPESRPSESQPLPLPGPPGPAGRGPGSERPTAGGAGGPATGGGGGRRRGRRGRGGRGGVRCGGLGARGLIHGGRVAGLGPRATGAAAMGSDARSPQGPARPPGAFRHHDQARRSESQAAAPRPRPGLGAELTQSTLRLPLRSGRPGPDAGRL